MPWVAALISAGVGALQRGYDTRKAAASDRDQLIREYQESVRSQAAKDKLFWTTTGRDFGADFLSKMKSGGNVTELMESIGKDTALGQKLEDYNIKAQQAVSNAHTQNTQQMVMAGMQGRQALLSGLAMEIEAMQGAGAAQAAQATSGIRSDRGTGGNIADMQDQQARLARESFHNDVNAFHKETMFDLSNRQMTASQAAEALRRERRMTATEKITHAMNEYSAHIVEMQDMDETQAALLDDAKSADKEADGWLFKKGIGRSEVERRAEDHNYTIIDYSDVEIKFEDDV